MTEQRRQITEDKERGKKLKNRSQCINKRKDKGPKRKQTREKEGRAAKERKLEQKNESEQDN